MMNTLVSVILKGCFIFIIMVLGESGWAAGETTLVYAPTSERGVAVGRNSSISSDGRYVMYSPSCSAIRCRVLLSRVAVRYDLYDKTEVGAVLIGEGLSTISANGRYIINSDDIGGNAVDIGVYDFDTNQSERIRHLDSIFGVDADSKEPRLSADGRYIAFYSSSAVEAGDTNGKDDIYLYDRLSKKTKRVSVSTFGNQGNGISRYPEISANGRFVSFYSEAKNLVDGHIAPAFYVRDRLTQQTSWVGDSGTDENFKQNYAFNSVHSISANGRYIAFTSYDSTIAAGDINNSADVFVHDLITHENVAVSVDSKGKLGNRQSYHPMISATGRYVAFVSESSNLVDGDTNETSDIFIRDLLTKTTTAVSVDSNGHLGNNKSFDPHISGDGRFVTFESFATNLTTEGLPFGSGVFVRDRRVSTSRQADLSIEAVQKPDGLVQNSVGSYLYTIKNSGPDPVANVLVQHYLSNGHLVEVTPGSSDGKCRRYSTISHCSMGRLEAGAIVTLKADIKAVRSPVTQYLNILSGGRADPAPSNNYLKVETPVSP